MRPKTSKLNGRTNTTCSICGKRLASAAALRAHKNLDHTVPMKSVNRSGKSRLIPVAKKKKNMKSSKQQMAKLKSDIISSPLVILNKKIPKPASTPSVAKEKSPQIDSPTQPPAKVNSRPVQFECPICLKLFPIFFSASRHIEKFHGVDSEGGQVSPKSLELIKPITVEFCTSCKGKIYPSKLHFCQNMIPTYLCSGCNKAFSTMKSFDLHISRIHHEGIESLFFPSNVEFCNWKDNVEMQIGAKYSIRGKYENKQYYGCTTKPTLKLPVEGDICFCPSAIITQEFTKGIQAHFYTFHYGHACKKFSLGPKYKKYSISSFMETTEVDITNVKADDNDLYIQFKTLMESIVLDSAKINIDNLRILIGKALEMTSFLNNYEEEDDIETKTKNNTNELLMSSNKNKLTDNEISKALEGLRSSNRLKRKASIEPTISNTDAKTIKELKSNKVSQLNKELAKVCEDINRKYSTDTNDEKSKGKTDKVNNSSKITNEVVKKKVTNKSEKEDVLTQEIDKVSKQILHEIDLTINNAGVISPIIPPTKKRERVNKHDTTQKSDDKSEKEFEEMEVPVVNPTAPLETGDKLRKALLDKKGLESNNESMPLPKPTIKPKDIKELIHNPASFNDSYREFVAQCKVMPKTDKNNLENSNKIAQKPKSTKKKTVFKTKMGHFRPNTSPKKLNISPQIRSASPIYEDSPPSPILKPKKSSNIKPKIVKQLEKSASPIKPVTPLNKHLSPNIKNTNRSPSIKSAKSFKTNSKPSSPYIQPAKSESLTNLSNVKIDRYEVKEQENDCNILILKI